MVSVLLFMDGGHLGGLEIPTCHTLFNGGRRRGGDLRGGGWHIRTELSFRGRHCPLWSTCSECCKADSNVFYGDGHMMLEIDRLNGANEGHAGRDCYRGRDSPSRRVLENAPAEGKALGDCLKKESKHLLYWEGVRCSRNI